MEWSNKTSTSPSSSSSGHFEIIKWTKCNLACNKDCQLVMSFKPCVRRWISYKKERESWLNMSKEDQWIIQMLHYSRKKFYALPPPTMFYYTLLLSLFYQPHYKFVIIFQTWILQKKLVEFFCVQLLLINK